jgi:hypothetical protein
LEEIRVEVDREKKEKAKEKKRQLRVASPSAPPRRNKKC